MSDLQPIPRYCFVHETYKCDTPPNFGCEYMTKLGTKAYQLSEGNSLGYKDCENGLEIFLYPMGANVRVCVGLIDSQFIDKAWCYDRSKITELKSVLTQWNGIGDPPDGWHREVNTGRRRDNGDPEKEHHRW